MSDVLIEPAKAIAPLPSIPQMDGGSRLHLVSWDADRVLVAWTLTHEDIGWVRQRDGGTLVLRLYVEHGGRAKAQDYPLERWIGHQIIPLPEVASGTTAAVGYLIDETFVHIVRADTIARPRSKPGSGRLRMSEPKDGDRQSAGNETMATVSLVVDLPPLRGRAHQDARWVVDGLLPCLIMARALARDGITGLGFAVSPLLLEQLSRPRLKQAVLDVFDGRLAALDSVIRDPVNSDHDRRLAQQDRAALDAAQTLFRDMDGRLSRAFKDLVERGVELLTQPASDALVHRLARDPGAVLDQLRLAGDVHRAHLGVAPAGVCLARSGVFNGIGAAIDEAGLGFALVAPDAIRNASAAPSSGLFAPLRAPEASVLFYGARQAEGDTSDAAYREAGLRAARTVGEGPALSRRGDFGPYHLEEAHRAARDAAGRLVERLRKASAESAQSAPHQVFVFDGHRLGTWFEASVFLAAVARQLVAEPALELITVATHRARGPVVQIAAPDAHYPTHHDEARETTAASLRIHLHQAAIRLHETRAGRPASQALSMARASLVLAQGLVSDEQAPSLVHAVRQHLAHCHELLDLIENEKTNPLLFGALSTPLGGFAGLALDAESSTPNP